jgi:hypothetical protein
VKDVDSVAGFPKANENAALQNSYESAPPRQKVRDEQKIEGIEDASVNE